MTIVEYKNKVIELFMNGNPSMEQWRAMSDAVLYTSESNNCYLVKSIDKKIDPEMYNQCRGMIQ